MEELKKDLITAIAIIIGVMLSMDILISKFPSPNSNTLYVMLFVFGLGLISIFALGLMYAYLKSKAITITQEVKPATAY